MKNRSKVLRFWLWSFRLRYRGDIRKTSGMYYEPNFFEFSEYVMISNDIKILVSKDAFLKLIECVYWSIAWLAHSRTGNNGIKNRITYFTRKSGKEKTKLSIVFLEINSFTGFFCIRTCFHGFVFPFKWTAWITIIVYIYLSKIDFSIWVLSCWVSSLVSPV